MFPRYRSTSNVKLPLRVTPSVTEVGTSQVQYSITVKANFNNKLSANNIVLRIPTPLNATAADCKVATGKAKYVPAENVVVWKCVVFFLHFFESWKLTSYIELRGCKVVKNVHLMQRHLWPVQRRVKSGQGLPSTWILKSWCSLLQGWSYASWKFMRRAITKA